MTQHDLKVKIEKPFANLFRKSHVMIVVKDIDGNFVLGTKTTYPEGISRFLGGGVDKDENIEIAAKREVKEEIGVDNAAVTPLTKILITASTENDEYILETTVYFLDGKYLHLSAGDDVSELVILKPKEILDLADKYDTLTGTFTSGSYSHQWSDYGKVYGPLHRIVYEELNRQGLL
jgi:8-oxo-dGTP pyrophosphatase MutT (NUDIX family)